ncbi:hypothetical protein Dsin_031195 [Dipteronia sinensis]|uniref:Reverse transcriptase zinc-binding domain-containing protein n=1 Tax=Dipteronia sinensis TaxID=43782 RepID=A0AAD9ZMD1_9ROSI|nr:hypothetical protein Dsin_031195 [Dipteronia sinensis]
MFLIEQSSTSGLGGHASWWKYIWRIQIPLKIKVFICRACHYWLPAMVNLVKRGVQVDSCCPLCKRTLESMFHALWGYPKLKLIRREANFMKGMPGADSLHFQD